MKVSGYHKRMKQIPILASKKETVKPRMGGGNNIMLPMCWNRKRADY